MSPSLRAASWAALLSACAGPSAPTSPPVAAGPIAVASVAPVAPAPVPVASVASSAGVAAAPPAMKLPKGAEDTPLDQKSLGALRVGMRVQITRRDRGLDPDETGHVRMVALGPGQVGTIERFVRRKLQGYTFDVVVVRWDAQKWHEWEPPYKRMKQGVAYGTEDMAKLDAEGEDVELGAFTTTTHGELLTEFR